MLLFRITVKVSTEETPCSHEASDIRFNLGHIVQHVVTYATAMYS